MSAKSLMVQGTMSGVGKSLLVAGLARVLAQDGHKVAPFKSQNMALNSAITKDCLEMGRAQVVQAEAAGVEPSVLMNPILLKPTTDTGRQVIVNGKPIATMSAREYFAFKHELIPDIRHAYDELAQEYDIILIEGAGSPAEINLKAGDIVNMGMAKMASSPVLLAGDIDRGGVFAQLIGTMILLDPDERAMVKAAVVNKFRGDKTILDPGLDILCEQTGVPVAGVIPYAHLDIDDEDSMSSRLSLHGESAFIDIVVVRLPRISNFTDFIALEALDGVSVRYVNNAREFGNPDLVIIPGTKSTMADLRWLRQEGLEGRVLRCADAGVPVIGICGGYQMLGLSIIDECGVEGGGELAAMGLLPVRTRFSVEKRTVRVEGAVCDLDGALHELGGSPLQGYEIHMGETQLEAGKPFAYVMDVDGTRHDDGCQVGSVYGSYLHGLFDSPACNAALVCALLERKGLDRSAIKPIDMQAYRQQQYDVLADLIRENMDMELVYRILEEGI